MSSASVHTAQYPQLDARLSTQGSHRRLSLPTLRRWDPAARSARCRPSAPLRARAQGKFYPFRDTFRRFHLMTVPLSPARAALLLGGAAKHMGYDTYQVGCGTTFSPRVARHEPCTGPSRAGLRCELPPFTLKASTLGNRSVFCGRAQG